MEAGCQPGESATGKILHVNWRRNLGVLGVGVFLTSSSYTMIVPFLPLYLLQELKVAPDAVNMWAGIIFSVTFLASALMAPCWGAIADKVGQKKMVIRAGFGLSICYFLSAQAQTPEQLLFVRCLTGVVSGFVPAAMALCSATLPSEKIGWGMGIMQAGVASGSVIGPLIGGYVSEWFSMHASFYVAAVVLSLAALAAIYFVQDGFEKTSVTSAKEIHIMRDLRLALSNKNLLYIMFLFFLVQACLMVIQPILTIYVCDLMGGMDGVVRVSGIIFSLAGIAGIIAAPFWGKTGQKVGYAKTLFVVFTCAGLTNLFQIAVDNIWQFAIIQFVFGLFLSGAAPNINAGIVQTTDPVMRGKAFGLVTSAQQFGGVMGPLVGGLLGTFLAAKYVLVFTGIVLLSTGFHIFRREIRPQNGRFKW